MTPSASPPPDPAQPAALQALLGYALPQDLAAAALAFLVRPDMPSERTVWQTAVKSTPAREAVLQAVWQLPRQARLPWLERLLTRCEAMEAGEKAQLRRHALAVVGADQQVTALEILTCLLVDHLLGLHRVALTHEVQRRSVRELGPAVHTFTALVARMPGVRQGADWAAGVSAQLALDDAAPLAPTDLAATTQAWHALQTLSAMARPIVMKAWVQQATAGGQRVSADLADALRIICLLMDTPLPPALVAWYGERGQPASPAVVRR